MIVSFTTLIQKKKKQLGRHLERVHTMKSCVQANAIRSPHSPFDPSFSSLLIPHTGRIISLVRKKKDFVSQVSAFKLPETIVFSYDQSTRRQLLWHTAQPYYFFWIPLLNSHHMCTYWVWTAHILPSSFYHVQEVVRNSFFRQKDLATKGFPPNSYRQQPTRAVFFNDFSSLKKLLRLLNSALELFRVFFKTVSFNPNVKMTI